MKISSDNVIKDFLDSIFERGLSENTLRGYRTDLNNFAKWFERTNNTAFDINSITSIDLRQYQDYLREEGWNKPAAPATIDRHMAAIRSLLIWGIGKEIVYRFPSFPKPVREQKLAPDWLERNQQNRLLREAELRNKPRDLAITRILLSCGLRVDELVSVAVADLELSERQGTLHIRKGKGKKERILPVPVETRKAVFAWLRMHPGGQWLFPSIDISKHMTTRNVTKIIKNIGISAGMDLHPHLLRHTFAQNLRAVGVDLVYIKELLGHESINTTAIYTRPSRKDLAEAVQRGEV